jgi:hypothetical protein
VACAAAIDGLAFGWAGAVESYLGEDISGVDCAKSAAGDGLEAAASDTAFAGVSHLVGWVVGDVLPSIARSGSRALGFDGDDVWRAASHGDDLTSASPGSLLTMCWDGSA